MKCFRRDQLEPVAAPQVEETRALDVLLRRASGRVPRASCSRRTAACFH